MGMSVHRPLTTLLLLAVAAVAVDVQAKGNLYRYTNDKGQTVIQSSIPPEYASKGYQVISPSGTVIQDVPPAAAPNAAAEVDPNQARNDLALRKLYSAPQDAERMRNRQMDALKLKADFARGQLLQLTNKRKLELEGAAKLERAGKPVPAHVKDSIERLNRQITDQEGQVAQVEAEKEKIRLEFEPVIERLKVLYPEKAAAMAAAAAAAAAAATPAPVAPAAPAAPVPAAR